ncbi:unnamed protein product [Allacma fusca]|uniref:Glutathione S-transferase n=1 Tax=Allacma fusca TaxID=39272 RepID=A0A8J2LNT5_9HEXA|nr:unnamed protein product [Allacma fusca]
MQEVGHVLPQNVLIMQEAEDVPPQKELFYLPSRGTGEQLRWFFRAFDIPFKNTLVRFGTTPDQMIEEFFQNQKWPLFVEDGRVAMTHPGVIARSISKIFKLVPEDPFLAYKVEQVSDIVEDCFIISRPIVMDIVRADFLEGMMSVPEDAFSNLPVFASQILGRYIEQLYGIMNEMEGDYILGDKLTYADITLAHIIDVWEASLTLKFMDKYQEHFRAYKNKILSLPQLQQWTTDNPLPIF